MTTLRARVVQLAGPRDIRFVDELMDPTCLSPDQVLAETIVSAISPGTELAAYRGAPPLRPDTGYPRLLGYCNVAMVVAAGANVTAVALSDRILTFASHRTHVMLDQRDILATVPPDVASEDAAVTYLYHLGYNAVLRANVRLGSTVVIIGLGVLGLATVALASMAGATVYAVTQHASTAETARRLGARQSFRREQLPELLAQLGPALAHAVVTTAGGWTDWGFALDVAGQQATVAVLGFPGREEGAVPFNPLDSARFYRKQLRILAAGVSPERPDTRGFQPFNERENIARLLEWIRTGRLNPSALVSGRFAGEDIAKAYERLLSRAGSPVTYLLTWGGHGH